MEDIKDTSTGKESSSFPATQNFKKNKIKKTNMNKKMKKQTNDTRDCKLTLKRLLMTGI